MSNSQKRLEQIFSQAPLAIAMLEGPDHVFIFANPSFLNLFNLDSSIIGRSAADVFPGSVEQGFIPLQDRVYRTGIPFVGKESLLEQLTPQGEKRNLYLDIVYEPVRGDDGQVQGILASAWNVTSQVDARHQVEEANGRLNLALESAQMGTWHIDLQTNEVIVSERTSQIFGSTLSQTSMAHVLEKYMHPDDVEGIRTVWMNAVRDRKPYAQEYRVVRPDGEIRWVQSRGEATQSSSGKPISLSGVLLDITERKIAQLNFEKALDDAPAMLWTTDAQGNCTYLSKQWFSTTGQTPETGLGYGWLNAVHPGDRERVAHAFKFANESAGIFHVEYRLRKSNGTICWVLDAGNARFSETGSFIGYAGTVVDIHDLKSAQVAAETANEAKSAFLANMSHEIRTPLGVIMGFADLLRDASISESERSGIIEIINRNGRSLSRIIDDILDLSKVESGRLEIEMIATSLPEIVHDIETLFSDQARLKGLTLHSQIQSAVPQMVLTDPTRLRQILVNVVGNAVKFTERGSIEIDVSCEVFDINENSLRIEIAVRDTGPGISASQRKHLFEPFVQADVSTTRKFGGTGLGLALSKRLCLALGGDITIQDSPPGKGSTFIISIRTEVVKFTTSEPTPAGAMPATSDSTPLKLDGREILLIEDAVDNQALISRVLSKFGARVTIASHGAEGIQKASAQAFDLVLMDIQMPVMDGYQALREFKRLGFRTPVVALTAHAMAEERRKTADAGFSAHVTKPIESEILVQTIASLIRVESTFT